MIYLASPYSHPNPAVVQQRFEKTRKVTADLMLRGVPVFSPIVHCHEIANLYEMPTDAAYWETYNTAFLRKSDMMYVLTLDGWKESLGVTQEIGLAKTLRLTIVKVNERGLTSFEEV
jgi:hypothetical protein